MARRRRGGGQLNLLPWPKVDFAKFGPIETRPLSRIKKISGANLHRNWVMIPHVTQFDEADVTDLEAFRVAQNEENEKAGLKLTMLAFLIKASVAALKKFPDFNASLDGENLIVKQYWHIGVAVDTPNGLVVPVLKNADQKGVLQIAKEMGELSAKAREGKLGPADMQGGMFLDQLAGWYRRHGVHADHQRARSRDPRRVESADQAGVGRQGVRAAPHAAALAFLRPPRDRRRRGCALHRLFLRAPGRHATGDAMSDVQVKVPDIGDFKDVPVIEVFVKPGDTVAVEDPLVTLESDKATMDVPAPAAGTVKEIKVKVGDKVSEGSLIVVLEAEGAAKPTLCGSSGVAKVRVRDRHLRRQRLLRPRPHRRPYPALRPTPARPTSNARCSCWARAPAATAPRSAPPTSA